MPVTYQKPYVPMISGDEVNVRLFREADNQVIARDDFVKLVGGKVATVGSSGVDADYDSTVRILGVARSEGRNTANPGQLLQGEVSNLLKPIEDFSVMTFDDDVAIKLLLPLWIATGGANATPAAIAPDFGCVLTRRAGIWGANIGVTANPNLRCVEVYEGQNSAENYGWAYFHFIASARALG